MSAIKNSHKELTLIAHIVPKIKGELNLAALRKSLLSQLPHYMMPMTFNVLDELPVTSTGKIDRNALSSLMTGHQQPRRPFVKPQTNMEKLLGEIWQDIFSIEEIGIDDNFFEIGGHSILATQMLTRLKSALDLEIPIYMAFDFPSIRELAKELEARLPHSSSE